MSTKKLQLPDMSVIPNPFNGQEQPNAPITDAEAFTQYFNQVTENDITSGKKVFCIMEFYKQSDITGLNIEHDEWINTKNKYFRNGAQALNYYANTPCENSQLIDATTIKQLITKRNKMLKQFHKKNNG